MLNKKNNCKEEKITYLEYLNENIKLNCYYIKANDLKKITGLNIKDIDDILLNNCDIPISKHRETIMGISQFYYIFPIELIVASFLKNLSKTIE